MRGEVNSGLQIRWVVESRAEELQAVTETADPVIPIPVPWKIFIPNRLDATLVGCCGDHLAHILLPRTGVREVFMVGSTLGHYWGHEGEFDLGLAELLLPRTLADPIVVCHDGPRSLEFYGGYDEEHYLLVAVKTLPGELWLKTMFIVGRKRYDKRMTKRGSVLYRKEAG